MGHGVFHPKIHGQTLINAGKGEAVKYPQRQFGAFLRYRSPKERHQLA